MSCSLCVCVFVCESAGCDGLATSSRLASTVLWGPGPGWPVAAAASRRDGGRCPWDRDRGLAFCGSFADLTCGLLGKLLGCNCN